MADRILRITTEICFATWYEYKKQIDIVKYQDGSYFSKLTMISIGNEKQTIKKQMMASEVETIMSSLSTLQIPAFPEHVMGCDGDFTEIEIGGYIGKSCYRWWSCPPEGWEKLDEIVQGIITLIAGECD